MGKRYKIVGHRLVRRVGRHEVPVAAAELAEDIFRLELIQELLKRVDPRNCATDPTMHAFEVSEVVMSQTLRLVKQWQRNAKRKLANEYLAP